MYITPRAAKPIRVIASKLRGDAILLCYSKRRPAQRALRPISCRPKAAPMEPTDFSAVLALD
jgi:hypothetical protein